VPEQTPSGESLNVLYISYDGMLEPLGQSQVVAYLAGLASKHHVVLVSYEKADDWSDVARRERVRRKIASSGIVWVPLRYHKSPTAPATAYDLACGLVLCGYLSVRHRVHVIHARSYVPAVIALSLGKVLGRRFLFDMRGFWADEKVEAGSWRSGSPLYRATKWFERRFLLDADAVVSLTHAAVDVMRTFPYLRERSPRFEVVTTCTDLDLFRPPEKRRAAASSEFVLGYVGAVGGWDVFDEVVKCFLALRTVRPNARFLVVNRGGHDYISACLARHSVPGDAVEVRAVEYAEVPSQIARMNAGVFMYKSGFSRAATAPTKLGEFLACGVPCLTRAGVGDVDRILESEKVGVVLRGDDDAARLQAVEELLSLAAQPGIQERCVAAAARHFALDAGIRAYDALYRELVTPAQARA
jgi:glycosyltransferase involved in cell wall biosynthesis